MSGIFGALGLNDTDRVFNATVGQMAIYEAAMVWVNERNAELNQAIAVFVAETTDKYKLRYKLPGGGRLQRRGRQGTPGAVKADGSWDVAFPLEDFGAQIAGDDVTFAYMTVAELERHLQTVVSQNVNTVRFEILKALLNNTQDTFSDELWGDLSIEPLANADSVVYPPVLGSETEATDDHYLESNYAASAISDTNDPYATIADELTEHFGASTGNDEIVVFINNAQTAKTRDLTEFVAFTDMGVTPGSNTATVQNVPTGLPGKIVGRMQDSGVWVVEWRFMPANYMLGIDLDAEQPLYMRIDPADTGLGQGLQLVAEDESFPFKSSFWRHRFGLGCSNRLNGVVMELGTGGTYTVPTGY